MGNVRRRRLLTRHRAITAAFYLLIVAVAALVVAWWAGSFAAWVVAVACFAAGFWLLLGRGLTRPKRQR